MNKNYFSSPNRLISSKMFSADILFPLNEQGLLIFSKDINKELNIFNRYIISLKWKKFIFLPQEYQLWIRCFQQIFHFSSPLKNVIKKYFSFAPLSWNSFFFPPHQIFHFFSPPTFQVIPCIIYTPDTKYEQKVIGYKICTPIIFKNPLKSGLSIRNIL